jgi:hypothetical protein
MIANGKWRRDTGPSESGFRAVSNATRLLTPARWVVADYE